MFERLRDFRRIVAFENILFEIHRVTVLGDIPRPFASLIPPRPHIPLPLDVCFALKKLARELRIERRHERGRLFAPRRDEFEFFRRRKLRAGLAPLAREPGR